MRKPTKKKRRDVRIPQADAQATRHGLDLTLEEIVLQLTYPFGDAFANREDRSEK